MQRLAVFTTLGMETHPDPVGAFFSTPASGLSAPGGSKARCPARRSQRNREAAREVFRVFGVQLFRE